MDFDPVLSGVSQWDVGQERVREGLFYLPKVLIVPPTCKF